MTYVIDVFIGAKRAATEIIDAVHRWNPIALNAAQYIFEPDQMSTNYERKNEISRKKYEIQLSFFESIIFYNLEFQLFLPPNAAIICFFDLFG